jgi:hypothetical protein
MYNPQMQQAQYYQQLYGPSSSTMASPYYYGYSVQAAAPRGGTFSTPQPHRMAAGPSYLYYPPTPIEGGSFSAIPYRPIQQQPLIRHLSPSPSPNGNFSLLVSSQLMSDI